MVEKRLNIGIVGCGAIGGSLARTIAKDFRAKAELVALFDAAPEKSHKLASLFSANKKLAVRNIDELIQRSSLVIESASAQASWQVAQKVLQKGRDIMVMSVGGLVGHFSQLLRLAENNGCRVYIPSGAIAGVDALKAAQIGKIKKIALTTRKNPLSFEGVEYVSRKGIKLEAIRKDKILFCGPAKMAVKFFPQNINVAAVLSLAGIGSDKTQVKIIASPSTKNNVHEIEIESEAGKVFTRTQNILHPDNPKTSYLAVLSAIATLKQILSPVKIGT